MIGVKHNERDASVRRLLEAERDRIADRVAAFDADLAALMTARRGAVDDDEHDPEGETLSARWSLLSGLREGAQDDARQAAAALHRLDAGTYGICARCGQAIPVGQLDVRPYRERCVACTD